MFVYKFVNVDTNEAFIDDNDLEMKEIEHIIDKYAKEGFRYVDHMMVANNKFGVFKPKFYKLIFEKEN